MKNGNMKSTLSTLAVVVSAATMAGSAQAGVVTSSISLDQFLNGSASYSGSFALAPLLASNGLTGGTFNSATLSAYGFSDTQINQRVNTGYSEQYQSGYGYSVITGYYSYSCGSWWSSQTCYGTNYGYAMVRDFRDDTYIDNRDAVADAMLLTSGSASATGTVGHTRTSAGSEYMGSYTRGNGTYGYDNIHMYNDYTTDVYSGALYTELGLGASDLLALAQNGQFDFLVNATSGNFHLQGLSITLDVDPAAPSQSVPEPGSALLMVGGLAGLAAAARRRRKQA